MPKHHEAEAALDALAGPNEFGLTQPQIESFRARLAEIEGDENADSVEFEEGERYGYARTNKCCDKDMLKIKGLRKPIEHFKPPKDYACRRACCSYCGKIGEKT